VRRARCYLECECGPLYVDKMRQCYVSRYSLTKKSNALLRPLFVEKISSWSIYEAIILSANNWRIE
jgi:hypothetical protein